MPYSILKIKKSYFAFLVSKKRPEGNISKREKKLFRLTRYYAKYYSDNILDILCEVLAPNFII